MKGVSLLLSPYFRITADYRSLVTAAVVIAVIGFTFNLIAAFGMLNAHKNDRLATNGLYAVFLNPMYTFQLLITVPGLLLLFNSWFVLFTIIPSFIAFKVYAKEEEKYLEEKFGAEYIRYRRSVIFKFL